MVVRGRENTWVKIKGVPKWLSPNEMIQNPKFKTNSTENQAKKKRAKTRLSQAEEHDIDEEPDPAHYNNTLEDLEKNPPCNAGDNLHAGLIVIDAWFRGY